MNLLISAIRTIFYDIDVGTLQKDIILHRNSFLKGDFAELTSWIARSFTKSELTCLQKHIQQQTGCSQNQNWHQMIKLLPLFANTCLTNKNGCPYVQFEEIQSWRQLSLLIGEDVLTTSFLAFDVANCNGVSPTSFAWPNIISHTKEEINKVLDKGLCDTHAHLKASADIFELTWMDFMTRLINRDEDYRKVSYIADAQVNYRRNQQNYEFRKMIQTAAILRLHIFEYLCGKKFVKTNAEIVKIIEDDFSRTQYLSEAESRVRCYQTKGNKLFGVVHDYAMLKLSSSSVYAVHEGERSLLFEFFRRYFKNDQYVRKIADLFFLYISLKIRARKEFIQTNPLYGFDNFKIYESRKTKFCSDSYKNIFPLYAVQSCIRKEIPDALESRVAPIEIPNHDIRKCIDGVTTRIDINDKNLTFVVHFIKMSEQVAHRKHYGTRYDYNQRYRNEIDRILEETQKRNTVRPITDEPVYKIVGIDAAGAEIDCSPAVFGQVYRYARLRGMTNLTYHVGEDFYDLCDGLRSIDDSIRFLNMDEGSRLGHAIALGVDPKRYYERRCFQTVMTQQRLLDTLAWIYWKAHRKEIIISNEYEKELLSKIQQLYHKIGYRRPFDIDVYTKSMVLRSDNLDTTEKYSLWRKAALCRDTLCQKARTDESAIALCHEFLTDKNIWEKGNEIEIFTYRNEIVKIVSDLQIVLLSLVLDKHIVVETNPSSNVVIGPIDGYDSHTVHKFIKDGIRATINTDDKGIFSTSLPNEYSLFACSAKNNNADDFDIIKNLEILSEEAKKSRFTPQKIN